MGASVNRTAIGRTPDDARRTETRTTGLIALAGFWFIVAGIGRTTPAINLPIPGGTGTIDMPAMPTGVAVFAAGVAIIWITRPTLAKG